MGDLVGAARAVALTGARQPGSLRGVSGGLVHIRSIDGVSYAADPNGHAVEVTIAGTLVLARWRDASARMVHLERQGCREVIGRHYRLTHLLRPGRIWIETHRNRTHAAALVIVDGIDGVRVRLRRVSTGEVTTARLERFDGRRKGYHPASEQLADLALELLGRQAGRP